MLAIYLHYTLSSLAKSHCQASDSSSHKWYILKIFISINENPSQLQVSAQQNLALTVTISATRVTSSICIHHITEVTKLIYISCPISCHVIIILPICDQCFAAFTDKCQASTSPFNVLSKNDPPPHCHYATVTIFAVNV